MFVERLESEYWETMAEANTKHKQLYLQENVKIIKELPHDLIRLCSSYQHLNDKFEENFIKTQQAFKSFENYSMYVIYFFIYYK